MRDSEVVAAIVAGDPAGLAVAYDRYAAPLYSYCRAMLREPADAADAVQDTFVIAVPRLSGLRDPDRLRSWLYAVARNECHRRLRSVSQHAPLEEAPELTDDAADVAAGMEQAELRALVRDALPGVGPAEREILELQLRQGLGSGEVASVLGISRNHAHALLSRARDQLETALAVLVVSRAGRQDCADLDELLHDWDGQLTVLLRKRVNRHVDRCPVCSGRRQREMTPAMLLGGVAPIAALPLAAAALPAGLRGQVLRAATGSSPPTAPAYPFGRQGFPRPLHPPKTPWWHPRPVHAGAVASTAAALAVGVTVVAAPPQHILHPPVGGTTDLTDSAGPTVSDIGRGVTQGAGGTARVSGPASASGPAGTGATAGVSVTAMASGTSAGSPSSPGTTAPASVPAPAPGTTSTTPAAGTLSVSPATLDVVRPASGAITLTATGGTVDWSVSEPPGLAKKVVVAPMSGTLAAGATATVTVTVTGPGHMHVHLTFSPGGVTVTVVIG